MSATNQQLDARSGASGDGQTASQNASGFDRRALLIATGVAVAGALGLPLVKRAIKPRQPVFIARNQRYDGPLQQTIQDGLLATGLEAAQFRGKRVLLKPNLVEPTRTCP